MAAPHGPAASPSQTASQNDSGIQHLELGKPIERNLAGGESHSYLVKAAASQYMWITVAQKHINAAVSALDPDGKKIFEADMFGVGDTESVWAIAETAGDYRVDVRSPDKTAPPGSYEITLKELRPVKDLDRKFVSAMTLVASALSLYSQNTLESNRKAVETFDQAIPLLHSIDNVAWEATALYLTGRVYISLGDKEKALDYSNRALPIAQAAANRPGEQDRREGVQLLANAIDTVGLVYNQFGDKKRALDLFNQALPLRRQLGDRTGELTTLDNIGMAHGYMGEWRQAMKFFEPAHAIALELGDRATDAIVLNNLCVANSSLGEYKKALDNCNQALEIRRAQSSLLGQARILDNIATIHASLGEYQQALDVHNQVLAIYRDQRNRVGEAISLHNIAWIYSSLGENQRAIDVYNQAIDIFRSLGDRYREALSLTNVAVCRAKMGDYRKALELHQQLLPIRKEVHDQEGEAITLNQIANCYEHLGEKQKVLPYYEQALAMFRTIGKGRNLVTTLNYIGRYYSDAGQHQKAMDYFNEGLKLSRTIGDADGEARILADVAQLELDRGDLAQGKTRIEEALAAIEALRFNVKGYNLRASFLASVRQFYEFDVDILMRLHRQRPSEGFDSAAFQASEKGRARSLLDLLWEASAEIRKDVDTALLDRERTLRQLISDKAERQARTSAENQGDTRGAGPARQASISAKEAQTSARGAASDKEAGSSAREAAAKDARETDDLATEYEQVQALIRQKSPRYAALTQPSPLTAKQIQSELLDQDTVLLEYSLGEHKSFLWAVTPSAIKSVDLPGREEIESAVRRFYSFLTERNRRVPGETLDQRRIRIQQADGEYPTIAAALSRMLLGPIASELKNKRLLIVGEGALQYLPFAALPDPLATGPESASQTASQQASQSAGKTDAVAAPSGPDTLPLVAGHEIITLPSAAVLAVLRRESAGRPNAEKTVAVFADPVFSADDPRVKAAGAATELPYNATTRPDKATTRPDKATTRPDKTTAAPDQSEPGTDAVRSATESGLAGLVRLRFSRREADQIVRLASEGKRLEAVDFAANRTAAISPDLAHYSILHFATHGLINNQHPELSGVVLSLVDERGRSQNGYLRLYDIYNLKLDAGLVVLSACQTALGKDIKGEGLIGLTRGFMYAGAPRVVASLWQVDDRATADLMGGFYAAMLRQGLRPAAALRYAQLSAFKDRRWQSPYYWAAFTLQGEWK
jgi:CHAT domain-containing protein